MRAICLKRWQWSVEGLQGNIMYSVKGKRGHMTANSKPCGCFIFVCLFIRWLAEQTRKHSPKSD